MKYGNLFVRSVSLAFVAAALLVYQSGANERAEILAANETAVAEVKRFNKKIQDDQKELERQITEIKRDREGIPACEEKPDENSWYIDGTYEGTGTGFGGPVSVSVTIENDTVAEIRVLAHDAEDPAYFDSARAVINSVLSAQSLDVDTVSGATFSSNGLLEAIGDALAKGERE